MTLLTGLVPSTPFLLAYSLPLLLLSVLLTFAGAFLTLDRTRSFPPSYDVIPGAFKGKKRHFYSLQGGIGGLTLGFVFGVHFSTFLSLLIPSVTPSAEQSPTSFSVTWILSAIVTAAIGGRWKYCALTFAGVSGGAFMALSLAVIVHPSLITRVVLASILTPALTIMTLVPLDRFQHASVRIAISATGAFGAILSIALLAHIPAWGNVWERWWLNDKLEWGSGKEKGLSAALCLIFITGLASDWFLHWKFGTCPDQKWDQYLSTYALNLPNRAGTYRPLQSIWDRIFSRNRAPRSTDTLLPSSKSLRFPEPLHSKPQFQSELGKRRETVKFKSFSDLESSCSSDSEEAILAAKLPSSETADVIEVERKPSPDQPVDPLTSVGFSSQQAVTSPPRSPLISPPIGAVPATPSLIKALDRIASAQQVAYQNPTTEAVDAVSPPIEHAPFAGGSPHKKRHNDFEWDKFWKDIKAKAVRQDRYDP